MLNPIQPHVGTNAVPRAFFFEKKNTRKKLGVTSSWKMHQFHIVFVCGFKTSRLDSYHKMLMLSFFNVFSLRRTWVCHTFHHEPNASQNRLWDLIVSDKANHQLLYRFEVILTYFEECIHHQNQRVVISVSVLELISWSFPFLLNKKLDAVDLVSLLVRCAPEPLLCISHVALAVKLFGQRAQGTVLAL